MERPSRTFWTVAITEMCLNLMDIGLGLQEGRSCGYLGGYWLHVASYDDVTMPLNGILTRQA